MTNIKDNSCQIVRPTFKSLEQLYRTRNMQLGLPINKSGGSLLPWGYQPHPDDSSILVFDEDAYQALCQSKEHLLQYGYRQVADWLSASTGTSVSKSGLNKLMIRRQPFDECLGMPYADRLKLAGNMLFPFNDEPLLSEGPFYHDKETR